jgi:hypothetical protein
MNAHGIAAPEPRVMVTVLGVGPDDVSVIDARRAHSDVDMVRVELGDVHFAGPLRVMVAVVESARNGGEGL